MTASAFGRKAAFRSALLMTGSTFVSYAIGLIVSTVVARHLGPHEYGQYSYVVWLSGVLVMLFNNGLTITGMRFISESMGRDSQAEARNVHGWLRKRYFASLLLVSIAFIAVFPWVKPAEWQGSYGLLAAAVLISALGKSGYLFESSVAKGYGLFNIEAHTTNTMAMVGLAGVLVLVSTGGSLASYLALFVVVSIGHTVMTQVFVRRADIHAAHGPLQSGMRSRLHAHLLWSIVLSVVAMLSNKSIETFLLNAMVGPAAVGFFAIAAAMTRGGIDLLASGLTSILLPMMSHAFGAGGAERVNRITSDAMRYFFFLGLLAAGVGVLWAAPAVTLMYGAQFSQATQALRVMVVIGGLTMAETALSSLLSTTDHQRLRVSFSAVSIVSSAVTALALIPRFGFEGALAAHAVARAVTFAAIVAGLVRWLHITLPWRELARIGSAALLAALPCGLLLMLSGGLWMQFAAGAVYGAGCIAASLLLRVWTVRDVSVVRDVSSRLPALASLADWLERHARPTE